MPFSKYQEHIVAVRSDCQNKDINIFVRKGGSGPGLLLLHGYPQTSHIWHKVADQLAERYTVVIPDLRGYGRSDAPPGSESHVEYSKREMANDQIQTMQYFSFPTFFVVGHDRGARVAHRLALDHPGKVEKLMVLDIAPTLWMYEHTDMAFAQGYWHWFFLIQPAPGPETTISSNPEAFWAMLTSRATHKGVQWSKEDVEEYQQHFFTPEKIHSSCEDYRASASIDLVHDRADREAGKRLNSRALRVLWGEKGMIGKMAAAASLGSSARNVDTDNNGEGGESERLGEKEPDEGIEGVVHVWKGYCDEEMDVGGRGVGCGHYIPEEEGEVVLREILQFMR